jgi:DNA-binding CsgD family transcriptional regulator
LVAPVTVSEKDLRTLLGMFGDGHADLPEAGLPLSLLRDLMTVVRCDMLSWQSHDSGRRVIWFEQTVPFEAGDGENDDDPAFWEHYWASLPCSYPERTGDLRSVTKVSDFYSARQWHSTGMYRDCHRPVGVEHEIMVCLPADGGWAAGQGRIARLIFLRGPGPDFSERDRALLTLLRPHLHQAYLDAERRRRPAPQLTPRQWEVLRLAAAGHTRAQIARQLGVTEGTVRIHLQSIYARLHVSNRSAAVARAFLTSQPHNY